MYPSLLENPDVPKQLQVMIYKFSEPLHFSLYCSYDVFFRGPSKDLTDGIWVLRPSSIKRLAMELLNVLLRWDPDLEFSPKGLEDGRRLSLRMIFWVCDNSM